MDALVKAALEKVDQCVAAIPWDTEGMKELAIKHGHTLTGVWNDNDKLYTAEKHVLRAIQAVDALKSALKTL